MKVNLGIEKTILAKPTKYYLVVDDEYYFLIKKYQYYDFKKYMKHIKENIKIKRIYKQVRRMEITENKYLDIVYKNGNLERLDLEKLLDVEFVKEKENE